MSRRHIAGMATALVAAGLFTAPAAAQGQRPQIETTKVDGTDNVYVFRNGNHQAIFIVTRDGVIATDPVAYGRPNGGQQYVDEIKKVTDKPIKYLIYSHHHFDHIAGGKAFKDAGATIVAHRRAKARVDLKYVGLNHSDSTLVLHLPKEKIVFVVDLIPVGSMPGRGLIDFYPMESEDSIKKIIAMDWERLIPGHPGAPNGRLGTKKDAQDQLTLLQEASAEVKKAAQEGKCWEPAEKELKLPKYASWPGYENSMQFLGRRYCGLWGRGT